MDVTMICPCPPKDTGEPRHPEGDTVTLRDKLDHRMVRTIRQAMSLVSSDDGAVTTAERLATCVEFYMLLGVTAWTFLDEKGAPVPVSHRAIRDRLLEAVDVETVSVEAERRYNPVVLLPLVLRASPSSPLTPTNGSTSPKSPTKLPKQSKPSLTSISPTAVTETTSSSLDGVSSSSQNSVSAA